MSSILLVYSIMVANEVPKLEAESIASKLNAFKPVRQLSILFERERGIEVGEIVHRLEIPTMLNVLQAPSSEERVVGYPNSMILVLNEKMTAKEILNSTLRDHHTVYVFITHSGNDIKPRLKQFWECLVTSAFALHVNGSKGQLYGFDPTPNDIQVIEKEEIVLVEFFNGHGLLVNTSVANIPPAALLLDDENDIEGYEGRLIQEVGKKFNLTTRFAKARDGELWGWLRPKPAGALGEVFEEYSAFAIGDIALTLDRIQELDQYGGYSFMECLTWAVPKGAGAAPPRWIVIVIAEYAPDAWLAIAISYIGITMACKIIDRENTSFANQTLQIFAVSIGSPIGLPSKAASRILMSVWVWATFILAVAYQASMGSKLTVPPEKPDIDTFEDLLESNLNLTGLFNSIKILSKIEDPLIQALHARLSPTTIPISSILERIATQRDMGYFRQIRTFRYNAVLDPLSLQNVHIMKSCPFDYFPSIGMTRWSPYYRGTRKIIQRLMESGLSSKWENDLMPELPESPIPPSPLNLNNLLGVFAALFAGYTVSAIVLLIEKIRWRLSGMKDTIEVDRGNGKFKI